MGSQCRGRAFSVAIGQYKNELETIERVYAEVLNLINTLHFAYFKTYVGEQVGYLPNGGGGGYGCK